MADEIYKFSLHTTGGLSKEYSSSNLFDIHHDIERDRDLDDNLKNILKFGYFWEFESFDYYSKNYVIDNCMHFIWQIK